MPEKVEVALIDGTWLEGILDEPPDAIGVVFLTDVHRSKDGKAIPLAKKVYVPDTAILFVVLEK